MKKLGEIEKVEIVENGVEIQTENGIARLIFMSSKILRMRLAFKKKLGPESTFAIIKTCWEDEWQELLADEREGITPIIPTIIESKKKILLETQDLLVEIQKNNFALIIKDERGSVIHSDLQELGYIKNKNNQVTHYSKLEDTYNYYGFGEKTGKINKKGKRLRMSNYDTPSYNPIETDPMYKHIPFYIRLDKNQNKALGIFYNDSDEGTFDLGNERSGYFEKYSYYTSNVGELDIYFIKGPMIKDVVENYTWLTGTTVMPPLATLGNLASTMYFTELDKDVDKEILAYVEKLKELDIPCDGYFLSSGYSTGKDGKRYVFTWNNNKFPDPQKFVEEMERRGAPVIPNIKPALLTTHPKYNDFLEEKAFLKGEKGAYIGRFWGGNGSFVDFLKKEGRDKWMSHMTDSLLNMGIKSIWNDNCEYELYEQAYYGNEKSEAIPKRPLFPCVMAKVAQDSLTNKNPHLRPFVMNRAGFAGLQRYAQTWSGDNYSNWDNLKYNIPTMLGMGLSGVANQGSDIGGFEGPAPTPELFIRWVQHGIFQPRFTIHSQNTDNTVTTPWMYTNYTDKVRTALKLRYTLIPYIYSLFNEANKKGSPITRAMVYEFQNDQNISEESFNFMLGGGLLVSSIVEEGQKTKEIYLPKGYKWYDYYTKKEYVGGNNIKIEVDIDSIPLYIREGAIIPTTEGVKNLNLEKITKQKIIIASGLDNEFEVYEDDGKTNEYKGGKFIKTLITTENNDQSIQINFSKSGEYTTTIKEIELEVILKGAAPLRVEVAGIPLRQVLSQEALDRSEAGYFYDVETRCARVRYRNIKGDYSVKLDFSPKDMTGILET